MARLKWGAPTGGGGGEARTRSMLYMSQLRRDVFQRSCWLKAFAHCRGSQAGERARDSRLWGAGRGEQRTQNIWLMLVTVDVSQLSGWLKASVP